MLPTSRHLFDWKYFVVIFALIDEFHSSSSKVTSKRCSGEFSFVSSHARELLYLHQQSVPPPPYAPPPTPPQQQQQQQQQRHQRHPPASMVEVMPRENGDQVRLRQKQVPPHPRQVGLGRRAATQVQIEQDKGKRSRWGRKTYTNFPTNACHSIVLLFFSQEEEQLQRGNALQVAGESSQGRNERKSEKRERKLIALLWAPFFQFDFDTLFFEHPACRKLHMYDSLSLRSRILFGDTFKGGGGPPIHCAKTPKPHCPPTAKSKSACKYDSSSPPLPWMPDSRQMTTFPLPPLPRQRNLVVSQSIISTGCGMHPSPVFSEPRPPHVWPHILNFFPPPPNLEPP